MSNRGLSTQPVLPGRKHVERYDIDWSQPDPYQPMIMTSWRTRLCWCKTPWSHR